MKWVSIQINQHILPTNYTVSQYNRNVDPGCSLCNRTHPEKLNLLLWGCPMVQHFWSLIGNLITEYYPDFRLGLKEAIFGDVKSEGNSVPNSLLVLARQFIYRQKFTTKTLDEVVYINYMKQELKFLYETAIFKGESVKFLQTWTDIMNHFDVNIDEGGLADR